MEVRSAKIHIIEPQRTTVVAGDFDVIISGGGPAGVCAAIAASRLGVSVLLLEVCGCLGGVATSGMMSNIIDAQNKGGLLKEIIDELDELKMVSEHYNCVDPEALKFVMEKKALETGVCIRLYTRVVDCIVSADRKMQAVITESASGREAWTGKVFIDATGNGDLGALANCRYESGNSEQHLQAASLCALIYGIEKNQIPDLIQQERAAGKKNLYTMLENAGIPPSYAMPTIFPISSNGYLLMSNHQYHVLPDDAQSMTDSTLEARTELWQQISTLRKLEPRFTDLHLGTTAAIIGLREGRRINALYNLSIDDLIEGRIQPDPVCKSSFSVDIHGAFDGNKGYTSSGFKVKPYDIPLRSLIAKDVSGLLLAGRCIGGDFYAHASYRVIGNAAPIGEAAGICAALAAEQNITPDKVTYEEFLNAGGNPHPEK